MGIDVACQVYFSLVFFKSNCLFFNGCISFIRN